MTYHHIYHHHYHDRGHGIMIMIMIITMIKIMIKIDVNPPTAGVGHLLSRQDSYVDDNTETVK